MQNASIKHHSVPQFYLAGFTHDGKADGILQVFDFQTISPFDTTPKNVGFVKRLYERECPDGSTSDEFETVTLKAVDAHFSKVLRRVLEAESPLSDAALFDELLKFVSLLHFRSPEMWATISLLGTRLDREFFLKDLEDGTLIPRFAEAKGRLPSPEEVAEFQRKYDAIKAGTYRRPMPKAQFLKFIIKGLETTVPVLKSRTWHLLVADGNATEFITSDTPVAIASLTSNAGRRKFPPGLVSPGTWMFLPLNTEVAIVGSVEGNHPRGVVGAKVVDEFNRITIANADRFVYSKRPISQADVNDRLQK